MHVKPFVTFLVGVIVVAVVIVIAWAPKVGKT